MKKRAVLSLLVILLVWFAPMAAPAADNILVGISKIVAHPALDALEQGVQDGIKEKFPQAVFDLQNANGELSTAASIAQKFKAEQVSLAVGIATPTAQALVGAIKDRPVLFCAVTDPEGAGLVASVHKGEKYVTGTSDMTPVKEQIALLNRIKPIKKLGHVYCSNEANAVTLAAIARQVCKEMGIIFIETTVTNSAEVKQAVQTIASRVDGIYLSNDNTIFSALGAVTEVAMKYGIPVMSADPSSAVDNDVLAAWGFDYYKMGEKTGHIAADILKGASPVDIPTVYMTDPSDVDILLNMDVAKKLGLSFPDDIKATANKIIENGKLTEPLKK
ncbi:putative ABC transport system substrate-binding protein [Desulfocicer vacuolatum DSM 3385]|uniref:Putative ABC transport system substrate-binding protein n=1 Tax=Desulfocicer vacuolatum DSM 3385 TaxID=1121400 RepID=A0A1W1YQP3_9BACT|nr:ABC transporter substrate-binding protein [Desulfocicer vacuolatum]SMC38028.1 putative ABC transport system substrate-binding protein [Desulfocicer vacuolatum DSM 3385]